MPRQLWIADRLRAYGLDVVEVDGWRERGSTAFDPHGVVAHHTAGAATGEMPSLRLLIAGRSDLPGPLCHVGLGRSGKCYVIAAGRANHAGAGGWKGMLGNSSVLGIEAESSGSTDGTNWTTEQRRVYPILSAALKNGCKNPTNFDLICGHKEWTSRKVDPRGIDMAALRTSARTFNPRPTPTPAPTPAPAPAPPQAYPEDNMTRHDLVIRTDSNGNGYTELAVDPAAIISIVPNGSYPPADGYWNIPVFARQDRGGKTIITTGEGPGGADLLVSVWVAG